MRSTIFSNEKIILRMRSAENFPFCGKFSEVYLHLYILSPWKKYKTCYSALPIQLICYIVSCLLFFWELYWQRYNFWTEVPNLLIYNFKNPYDAIKMAEEWLYFSLVCNFMFLRPTLWHDDIHEMDYDLKE